MNKKWIIIETRYQNGERVSKAITSTDDYRDATLLVKGLLWDHIEHKAQTGTELLEGKIGIKEDIKDGWVMNYKVDDAIKWIMEYKND